MPLSISHYAVCTKKVDDGVVVAGKQADEIFEQHQKTCVDDGVRQIRLGHLPTNHIQ